jgi:DNA-binding FadR family transcriptional regulator
MRDADPAFSPKSDLERLAEAGRLGLARAARRRAGGSAADAGKFTAGGSQISLDADQGEKYIRINPINRIYMLRERVTHDTSEFLRYLATHPEAENGIPPLAGLSRELGLSLAALREQLEVARALGLVDVRPRTGTRRRPYSFTPAVRQSLMYALALQDSHFEKFAALRNHIEVAFWDEATRRLTDSDKAAMQALIAGARGKLTSPSVQVPHEEHRALHLLIFSRLENPFVTGILEAYWDMYEAVGLNLYSGDMAYLNEVWDYHARMVDCICAADYAGGREALVAHVGLLMQRPAELAPPARTPEGER